MSRLHVLPALLLLFVCLTGCHSMSGNVIPQSGPTMEGVYDRMGVTHSQDMTAHAASTEETDLSELRQTKLSGSTIQDTGNLDTFQQLPNPLLKLYVYPHFSGSEEVPIPGYYTQFNAYDHTHYLLPSETTG